MISADADMHEFRKTKMQDSYQIIVCYVTPRQLSHLGVLGEDGERLGNALLRRTVAKGDYRVIVLRGMSQHRTAALALQTCRANPLGMRILGDADHGMGG